MATDLDVDRDIFNGRIAVAFMVRRSEAVFPSAMSSLCPAAATPDGLILSDPKPPHPLDTVLGYPPSTCTLARAHTTE